MKKRNGIEPGEEQTLVGAFIALSPKHSFDQKVQQNLYAIPKKRPVKQRGESPGEGYRQNEEGRQMGGKTP